MIIADTGFWVALFDPRDNHHQRVRAYALTINEAFITTLPYHRSLLFAASALQPP